MSSEGLVRRHNPDFEYMKVLDSLDSKGTNTHEVRLAVNGLLERGLLPEAAALLERWSPPDEDYGFFALRRMLGALPDRLPRDYTPMEDDVNADFQLVRARAGASAALIMMCGLIHRFAYPLPVVRAMVAPFGAHVIFLRDFEQSLYLNGIRSAPSYSLLVSRLRSSLEELGVDRAILCGSSASSYAALKLAPDLEAEFLLLMAGPSTIQPEDERPVAQRALALCGALGMNPDVITPALLRLQPRIRYYFADGVAHDRANAERIAKKISASAVAVLGHSNHVVLDAICAMGLFQADVAAAVAGAVLPDPAGFPGVKPLDKAL